MFRKRGYYNMFPIPFNFPFRKSNGDISTIGAEISAGGGGSSYTLPTASASVKGGVKVGEGLTMDGEVLKNTNPTPATPYTLPTASAETLGGVKVGTGLTINENGVLSASGGGGGSGISSGSPGKVGANGTGGDVVDVPDTVYEKIKTMSIEELADWLYANCEWLSAAVYFCMEIFFI